MTCRTIGIGGGGFAIVCSRGERKRKCKNCGGDATLLCDFELRGSKAGKTCDAPMCQRDTCAHEVGPDRHYCRVHYEGERANKAAAEAWLAELVKLEENAVDREALLDIFPEWENDFVAQGPRGSVRSVELGTGERDYATMDKVDGVIGVDASPARLWSENVKRDNAAKRESIGDKVRHVNNATQTRDDRCHWPSCPRQCKPAYWGCTEHWYKLPKYLRDKIWATYRSGQEATMTPSRAYVEAAREVEAWIIEHHFPPTSLNDWGDNIEDDYPSESEIMPDIGSK